MSGELSSAPLIAGGLVFLGIHAKRRIGAWLAPDDGGQE